MSLSGGWAASKGRTTGNIAGVIAREGTLVPDGPQYRDLPACQIAKGSFKTEKRISISTSGLYQKAVECIKSSDIFDIDERPGHYSMGHIITLSEVIEAQGFALMECFVPIKLK